MKKSDKELNSIKAKPSFTNPNQFKPGQSGNPAGRPKGSLNITTRQVKEAYAKIIVENIDNIYGWLARTALEDPKGAIESLMKISSYVIPKEVKNDITSAGEKINIILPNQPKED
jgi:hypothetical protein